MPVASPATENRDYEARHLLVLEGLEAVRKRPAMYIGSTDTRGLMHCLWEIIDNAVDEALGGFGREILVTLRSDGGISVHDRGRGIPVDIEPRTGPVRGRGGVHQAARRAASSGPARTTRPAACTVSAPRW